MLATLRCLAAYSAGSRIYHLVYVQYAVVYVCFEIFQLFLAYRIKTLMTMSIQYFLHQFVFQDLYIHLNARDFQASHSYIVTQLRSETRFSYLFYDTVQFDAFEEQSTNRFCQNSNIEPELKSKNNKHNYISDGSWAVLDPNVSWDTIFSYPEGSVWYYWMIYSSSPIKN